MFAVSAWGTTFPLRWPPHRANAVQKMMPIRSRSSDGLRGGSPDDPAPQRYRGKRIELAPGYVCLHLPVCGGGSLPVGLAYCVRTLQQNHEDESAKVIHDAAAVVDNRKITHTHRKASLHTSSASRCKFSLTIPALVLCIGPVRLQRSKPSAWSTNASNVVLSSRQAGPVRTGRS